MSRIYPKRCVGLSFLVTIAAALSCEDSKACPPEKPFCTPIGCVESCPENTFENGTQCVTDCGDGIVDGNKCKTVCPPDKNYTEEKEFLYGYTFRRFRFCLNSCHESTTHSFLAYNNSCVRVCPTEASFIINTKCSSMCPETQPFMYEIRQKTFNLTNVRCLKNCPPYRPYSRNLTCVSQCFKDEVLLDNKCVIKCPNSSYVLYENTCMIDCPFGMFKRNLSCVNRCHYDDDQRLHMYILNTTCVEKCPLGYDFVWNTSNGLRCVHDCGKGYHRGSECVTECDHLIANRSCVPTCPLSMPFLLKKQEAIDDGIMTEYKTETTCVSICPTSHSFQYEKRQLQDNSSAVICMETCPTDKPFSRNHTCVSKCFKDEMWASNRTCLEKCPGGYRYMENTSYGYLCRKDCGTKYRAGWECVETCDYAVVNGSCVQQCPSSLPFLLAVKKREQWTYKTESTCVSVCPDSMFYYKSTCVARCPYLSRNKTCLTDCPVKSRFVYGSVCLQECPINTFIQNLSCVHVCQKLVYNNMCLDKCPPEQPYTEYDIMGKNGKCVGKCGDDKLANGTTCIDSFECNKPIEFNGQCLDTCPEGSYWVGASVSYGFKGNCQSPWTFYGAIIGSPILMTVLLIACIKCFRFRCSRQKQIKQCKKQVSQDDIPLLNDLEEEEEETVDTCGQNNIV